MLALRVVRNCDRYRGARDERLIVVLNDNDMSIAPPTGALSAYLARITSSGTYLYMRDIAKQLARRLPKSWERRAARMEEYTRHLWQGGAWFEELGFFGDASTVAPYVASMGRRSPDPIVSLQNMETFVHLAGQGLMLESPSPLRALPEPAAPPIVEVTRNPDPAPRTVLESMRFWLDLALGSE